MRWDLHETSWTVLKAATNGDNAAQSQFARSYETLIRDFLQQRWRGSSLSNETEDAVQEVFIECLKPNGVLDRADPGAGDFRALLYGVVRNTARRFEERWRKHAKVSAADTVLLQALPGREEQQSRAFDRAWARALLREAILQHARAARCRDEDYRRRYRVLRLRHQQGLQVREIAERLDVGDVQQVHQEYRRARREFRSFLREVVAAHTGARGAQVDREALRVTELLGT